jgi:predicted dinucleotide-binding enzyme
VVKAFTSIDSKHLGSLQRPEGHPERSALAIAGDDASLGYDTVGVGSLAEGWRYQPDTLLTAGRTPPRGPNGLARGRPASAAELAGLLAAAAR